MFQQRHYEAVASHMRALKATTLVTVNEDTKELWVLTVGTLSAMFRKDNSRFNPSKFIEACGMGDTNEHM